MKGIFRFLITSGLLTAMSACQGVDPQSRVVSSADSVEKVKLASIELNHDCDEFLIVTTGENGEQKSQIDMAYIICDLVGGSYNLDEQDLFDLDDAVSGVDQSSLVTAYEKITKKVLESAKERFSAGDEEGFFKQLDSRQDLVLNEILKLDLDRRDQKKFENYFSELKLRDAYGNYLTFINQNNEKLAVEISYIYDYAKKLTKKNISAEDVLEAWPKNWKKQFETAKQQLQNNYSHQLAELNEKSSGYEIDMMLLWNKIQHEKNED